MAWGNVEGPHVEEVAVATQATAVDAEHEEEGLVADWDRNVVAGDTESMAVAEAADSMEAVAVFDDIAQDRAGLEAWSEIRAG